MTSGRGGAARLGIATLLLSFGAVSGCGGRAGQHVAYSAESAPSECVELLGEDDRAACLSGDGDSCARAVKKLEGDITFADSMGRALPTLHAERIDCLVSFTTRGCQLGSAWACSTLARGLSTLGHHDASRSAALDGCALGGAEACFMASGIGSARAPAAPPAADRRALAEQACDLGSYAACFALGDLALFGRRDIRDPVARVNLARGRDHRDVVRGLDYYEEGCLRAPSELAPACQELRQLLIVPAMPRRGPDDWLPYLSADGVSPAGAPRSGGICDVDPSLCPSGGRLPPAPAPPPSERARIMDAHRAACAAGDRHECLRLVELELLRFDHSVLRELRNEGDDPPSDFGPNAFALCTRGVAGACLAVTYGSFRSLTRTSGGMPELLRACELGAPLGCALAANQLRARDAATRAQRQRLFAQACAGDLRWACTVSVR